MPFSFLQDKPGRKKEVEKKKTNLEMFKEELKMYFTLQQLIKTCIFSFSTRYPEFVGYFAIFFFFTWMFVQVAV